ncbi:MAG: ATP synthase F1 subunit gamma [Oscillospiraceae bacterium]|nr:ATP synthase F1 subunit gamma [Oscillospiraceae bacterium]
MANLRAIRKRIKSVENTQQITKSMKMVAGAKLRRTQSAFSSLRDYAARCGEMLGRVAQGMSVTEPLLLPHAKNERVCYVLIVGNRGLCGTYNSALLRYLEELAEKEEREKSLLVCGRWGKDMIPGADIPIRESFEISDAPEAKEAEELAAYLRELYTGGEADEIVLVYQRFQSVLQQNPGTQTLLPMAVEPPEKDAERKYIFEPDRESLLRTLTDMTLKNTLHAALLEARTGEHSARMTAMSAASDNTEELIGELTLQLNHARQAAITTEISEIAGGAEALRNK